MSNTKPEDKKYIIIGGVVCAIIAVVAMFASNQNRPGETDINAETEVTTNQAGGYTLTQGEAEDYCQDAGLISQYLNLEKVDIYASAFKADQPQNSYIADAFGYDKDGNSIVFVTWKGWDKTADEAITFRCYVSGKDKNSITLHMLHASENYSGQDVYLYGSENFDHYDKDGNLIPLE